MFTLRPYQTEIVEKARAAFKAGRRRVLVTAPTGAGKTIVFCFIARRALDRGRRVLILVHRQELLNQTSAKLNELGIAHGLIAAGIDETDAAVQVASVQTIARRLWRLTYSPDLIIVDEAHHATAGQWRQVLDHFSHAQVLGVTATPARLDGQPLGDVFDSLIVGPTVAELIASGFLSPYRVFAPPTEINLVGVTKRGGDFASGELEDRLNKPVITGSAVQHYSYLCMRAPAIAFCASVQHARDVAAQFREAGFKAESLDGTTSDVERARLIMLLGTGQLNVLTSCEIISEGTDIPVVSAAILLRPTQSLGLYLQQVGRVLRPAAGKSEALVIDHVGNVRRHGFPCDAREWSLEGRVREATIRVITCPRCFQAMRPQASCSTCGHTWTADEARRAARTLNEVDGELKELKRDELERESQEKQGEIKRARTLEDFQAIARARGYSPAWALIRWNARQHKRRAS